MITIDQKKKFDEDGYLIIDNVIEFELIEKCKKAYERIRLKCENFQYLYYRKFSDIALNDIYGIEHIFHPDIFEKDIFKSIMDSEVLEIAGILLNDKDVFLSRNRLHCTKNVSHSGFWHRDGTPTGKPEDIDKFIKNNQNDFHVQATLPYYKETGFYLIPGSHKFQENFIPTNEILGTKKILKNETRLTISPGQMIVFNPFLIHRGTCVGRKKNQRSHIHMRFSKSKNSKYADRYKKDNEFFNNVNVYSFANKKWKQSFDLKLDDPICWYGDEIEQKKIKYNNLKTIFKLILILYNRFFYYFSKFLPFEQRTIENLKFIKYPYLKDEK